MRRLAALERDAAPAPTDAFTQRLSGWFDWTDAIALSAALGGPRAPAPARPAADDAHTRLTALEREAARVRAALARAAQELPHDADEAEGFAPWRQRVLARQQAMEAAIGPLRRRVREALAGGTSAQARLAALDAVLEQVIGARERELLAAVPRALERRFEPGPASAAPAAAFRRELIGLLQAELDFRMQPVEGLLAALRPSSRETP